MGIRSRIILAYCLAGAIVIALLYVFVPSASGTTLLVFAGALAALGVAMLIVLDRLVLSRLRHLEEMAGAALPEMAAELDAPVATAIDAEIVPDEAAEPALKPATAAEPPQSPDTATAPDDAAEPAPPAETPAETPAVPDTATEAMAEAAIFPETAPMPRASAADLEHSQRLESIGLLAGGIAHDFNNLLTGILGQVSLALSLLPPDSPARPPINKAAGAAERAADMTRQLLAYAGKGQVQLTRVGLNDLIIENIGMLETELPGRAELKLELDPNLPDIEADRGQVQQVLMNLVLNAAESIEEQSGRVTVGTGSLGDAASAGRFLIGGETLGSGTYVFLSVADTGVGMDDETLAQIFDPFFSTKGSGRGLGLSAALGIVRAHQGAIDIDSALEGGTRFRVLFPSVRDPQPPAREHSAPSFATLPEKATSTGVLVIDDETAVREATSDMLRAAGMTVLTAGSGQAGIDLFDAHGSEIGVVLLDMQMPGMNGERTFDGLKKLDAGVRVVLMSGYSESEATHRFMGRGLLAFLQKPFDFDTLLRVVGDALDTGPRRS